MADRDSLYHRLFSHPIMVEGLVKDFIPEVLAAGGGFDVLERVPAKSYARKRGDRRDGDVIWKLRLGTAELFLYILFEFQSDPDWWMGVRGQVSSGLFWQDLLAGKELKAG